MQLINEKKVKNGYEFVKNNNVIFENKKTNIKMQKSYPSIVSIANISNYFLN